MPTQPPIAALKARRPRATPGLKPVEAEARDLFRRPLVAAGAQALRRGGVRSAAPGRGGAGARAREERGAGRDRGVVQSGDVCARCAHPDRRRLSAHGASRRSISSAIRRMSRSWRGCHGAESGESQIGAFSANMERALQLGLLLARRAAHLHLAEPHRVLDHHAAALVAARGERAERIVQRKIGRAADSASTSASSTASPAPEARCGVVACAASPIRIARPRCQGCGSSSFSSGR